jgi:hypothetical protein
MKLIYIYTVYFMDSLYVCMAIKHIIVLFVETPRKFITAVINLRGVSTNKTIIYFMEFYGDRITLLELSFVAKCCKMRII